MTRYALFDSKQPSPQPVLGWYDTAVFNYPNLPDSSNLLKLTDEQWLSRRIGRWAVSGGTLIAYVPPPSPAPSPPPVDDRYVALEARITALEKILAEKTSP